MKLINFSFDTNIGAIGLNGFDVYWDLHNHAIFDGLNYNAKSDNLDILWSVPNINNPWGDERNKFLGCFIRFHKIEVIRLIGNIPIGSMDEKSLESVSWVCLKSKLPDNSENPCYRIVESHNEEGDYGLLFSFYGGIIIEVFSESAELFTST